MEITHEVNGATLDMRVSGRLDGYWADHLNRALSDVVGDGRHRIRLDCSALSFISSAGIAVLLRFRKELARIDGSFYVVNPSKAVATVLQLTRVSDLLLEPAAAPDTAAAPGAAARPEAVVRHRDIGGAGFDIYDLDARAQLTWRAIGDARALSTGAVRDEPLAGAGTSPPAFAVGVGAFGDSFDDCRARFGELLSVAGATVYQPADGTNVADYLLAKDGAATDVRLLYGLAGDGRFSHLVRFDAQTQGASIGLSAVLNACLDLAGARAIGVVLVAETAGLVGAALRRSPADSPDDGDFFALPGVRGRLAFTAEPAFARGVALAAGIAARVPLDVDGEPPSDALRPIGTGCTGHLHAAAFPFRALRKGRIDLAETVSGLFETDQPLGVLHLLHDDRGAAGVGESELVRGACWISPIAGGR
ncbi:MAG TPA: STAS domain-containing protein [Vicinamibacterales bacterium]